MTKIVFYQPSSGPGGIQSIITRISQFAENSSNIYVVILASPGDWLWKEICALNFKNNKVILVDCNNPRFNFKGYTFISFNYQLNVAYFLYKNFNINFIFWDVHSATIPDILNFKIFNKILKKINSSFLVHELIRENRVITIDLLSSISLLKFSKYNGMDDISISGIPIDTNIKPKCSFNRIDEKLHIIYIARAVSWKIFPFFDCLKKIQLKFPDKIISCSVYTDNISYFKSHFYSHDFINTEVSFYSGYGLNEIWDREISKVSLAIGMGTAQFESLMLNIPTLTILASDNRDLIKSSDPIWLHTLPNFVFGYDDESINYWKLIDTKNAEYLSTSNFSWNQREYNAIKTYSDLARNLYSVNFLIQIFDFKIKNLSSDSYLYNSRIFKIKYYYDMFIKKIKFIVRIFSFGT
jgi:hypothetical protein